MKKAMTLFTVLSVFFLVSCVGIIDPPKPYTIGQTAITASNNLVVYSELRDDYCRFTLQRTEGSNYPEENIDKESLSIRNNESSVIPKVLIDGVETITIDGGKRTQTVELIYDAGTFHSILVNGGFCTITIFDVQFELFDVSNKTQFD